MRFSLLAWVPLQVAGGTGRYWEPDGLGPPSWRASCCGCCSDTVSGGVPWGGGKTNQIPPKSHGSSVFHLYLEQENSSWPHQAGFFCGFDACAATNPCSPRQHLAPSHPKGGSAQGFHPAACNPGVKPIPPPLISDGNGLNPTGSCSWEPCPGKGTSSSNRSLNCFQLGLRERLCEAESHQAPGSPRC